MTGRKNNSRMRRIAAIIMAVMMIVVVMFSSFVIACEAEHDCTGEDCHICECIETCIGILTNLGIRLTKAIHEASLLLLICGEAALVISVFKKETPVTTKVRLNN